MNENKLTNPIINSEGYLINFKDWNEKIANSIAKSTKISLKKPHWEIIYFVRNFYREFNISPTIRLLIKVIATQYGEKKGNSMYLFKLFPKNEIAQEIAKISGLPKPTKCL